MDRLQTGSLLLFFAAVFVLFIWLNHRSGLAIVDAALAADKRKNPIGFWIVQILTAALALLSGAFGVLTLMGVTRP
ncbi:MAG: hypothetical protein K2X34_01040 [Hyphomonadaceae bacterium]|nr:hypothetical protein [Hyphomonadaceae bacterium]